MAEGLLRQLAGDRFDVFSAGIEAGSLRPQAVAAMKEIGVDISMQPELRVRQVDDPESTRRHSHQRGAKGSGGGRAISSSISSRALVKAYWDDFAVAVVACSINRASAAI